MPGDKIDLTDVKFDLSFPKNSRDEDYEKRR
jgi:hypothetical protein